MFGARKYVMVYLLVIALSVCECALTVDGGNKKSDSDQVGCFRQAVLRPTWTK